MTHVPGGTFIEHVGPVLAAVVGCFLRGIVGPGPWQWGEFFKALFAAVICVIWIGPGIVEYFGLGPNASASIGVIIGMTALPVVRGIIELARAFRDNPGKLLGRRNGGKNDG